MATYVKGTETKKQLIMLTYRKLCEQDASSFTVRDIAKEKGCSAAAIYRHFESFDYLIVVSSVRFLHEYMNEYAKLMDEEKPFLEIYLEGWELFNRYAFRRPDIYYRMFWGKENIVYSEAFQDYFELFPFTGSEKYMAHFYTLMFNPNMQERDFLMLRRAENYGLLSDGDAKYFSMTNCFIVKGMLEKAMGMPEEKRKEAEKECSGLLRKNMEKVI